MCVMMTEIKTINGGQKDALFKGANVKKLSSLYVKFFAIRLSFQVLLVCDSGCK